MRCLVQEFLENELGYEFDAYAEDERDDGEDFDVGYDSRLDER